MSKRLDKIKSARSLGDVMDVVDEIGYDFKNSSAIVKRIISSLSAELVIDGRQKSNQPKIKDIKFVAPNANELKKHVEVLHKLNDNVMELEAAEAMIKQSFAGNKKVPAALKAIKELKQDLDGLLNDAYAALHETGNKHIPTKLATLVDDIVSHLIDVLPVKKYSGITQSMLVVPDPTQAGIFHFCCYIGIENLQNSQGFMYRTYYVMVTGVVNSDGGMHVYLNSLPDFKVPGKYPIGKEISDISSARKRIDILLDHNNFVIDHEKQTLNMDTDRANTAGLPSIKGVASAKVADDELLVILDSGVSERQREKITTEIRARLSSILGLKKNNQLFQHKYVQRGSQRGIKFILIPNLEKIGDGKKVNLSLQHLHEVSDLLGLSEQQQAALRFALQH
jgi:hypothetical protein